MAARSSGEAMQPSGPGSMVGLPFSGGTPSQAHERRPWEAQPPREKDRGEKDQARSPPAPGRRERAAAARATTAPSAISDHTPGVAVQFPMSPVSAGRPVVRDRQLPRKVAAPRPPSRGT